MDARVSYLLVISGTLLTGLIAPPAAAINTAEADIVGEARDRNLGELLYHELHYFSDEGLDHQVIYRTPDGEVLAEKKLDYTRSDVQPQLNQQNFACGESIGVSYAEDALKVSYRPDEQEAVETAQVERDSELVIDAGFDNLVRRNWQQVTAGDPLTFDYLVPSRFTSYTFRLKNVDCSESAEQGWQCFVIEPASWWLRMLVDPISLTYESSSRRLVEFNGLGNIASADCKYPRVKIRYEYAERPGEEGELVRFRVRLQAAG
ncbi:hypothetical protein F6455_05585 [Proteobacteria bacterium 005FR1]|nr:hypothetical protein [Proteobacteria bacterium 005FR1]